MQSVLVINDDSGDVLILDAPLSDVVVIEQPGASSILLVDADNGYDLIDVEPEQQVLLMQEPPRTTVVTESGDDTLLLVSTGIRGARGEKGDRGEKGEPGEDSTVPGPQGPPGQDAIGSAIETSYRHVQALPDATWTVNHNLGYRPGGLTILNTAGDAMEADPVYMDSNIIVINFSLAVAGEAYVS